MEYAKYVNEAEYPDEMMNMLEEYSRTGNRQVLEQIEAEFSIGTIKKVAAANALYQEQLANRRNQAVADEVVAAAKQYLDTNVPKYPEEFKNKAFAALFSEAFRQLGCELDIDRFVSLIRDYARCAVQKEGIINGILKENKSDTNEMTEFISRSSPSTGVGEDIDSMTEKELAASIRKYI